MNLTSQQYEVVLNYILADPVLGALDRSNLDLAWSVIEPALNAPSNPAFTVWTSVPAQVIMENGFIWSDVDALPIGKARIWEWMTSVKNPATIDATKPNVRQGLKDAFTNGSALYNQVISHCKRTATVLEKLFATGTGSIEQPGKAVVEGNILGADIAWGVGDLKWWIRGPE